MKAYGFEASVVALGAAEFITEPEQVTADEFEGYLAEIKMPEGFSPVALPTPQWPREGGRSIIAAVETLEVSPELYRQIAKPWVVGLRHVESNGKEWFYWHPLERFLTMTKFTFTLSVCTALDRFIDCIHAEKTKTPAKA